MHIRHIALLFSALFISAPLSAQTSTADLVRSLSRTLSNAAAASRQRHAIGPIVAPLSYVPAAGPIDPQNRSDPRNLDVAGVRLGMTVDEARAALRASGYVDENINSAELSYASLVTTKWAQDYGFRGAMEERVTNGIVWHKGGERVFVSLIELPDGPVVNEVHYNAGERDLVSADDLARLAAAKYGPPSNDDPRDMRWCTVKAPACENRGENEYPLLVVYPEGGHIYLRGDDPGRKAALERRFADDVLSRKPTAQAPSL